MLRDHVVPFHSRRAGNTQLCRTLMRGNRAVLDGKNQFGVGENKVEFFLVISAERRGINFVLRVDFGCGNHKLLFGYLFGNFSELLCKLRQVDLRKAVRPGKLYSPARQSVY